MFTFRGKSVNPSGLVAKQSWDKDLKKSSPLSAVKKEKPRCGETAPPPVGWRHWRWAWQLMFPSFTGTFFLDVCRLTSLSCGCVCVVTFWCASSPFQRFSRCGTSLPYNRKDLVWFHIQTETCSPFQEPEQRKTWTYKHFPQSSDKQQFSEASSVL